MSKIGTNPLDIFSDIAEPEEAIEAPAAPAPKPKAASNRKRASTTISLDIDLKNRMRNTIAGLSGPPLFMTSGRLFNGILRAELDRLEAEHNGGQPFPDFEGSLRSRFKG